MGCDNAAKVAAGEDLRLVTPVLSNGTVDVSYDFTIIAMGGTQPYTWSIMSGALPAGLELDADGTPATRVHGSPTQEGSFSLTMLVRDAAGKSAQRDFSMRVDSRPLSFTPVNIGQGDVGRDYSEVLTATGGARPYSWTVAGAVPPGLALVAAGVDTAAIQGTPTTWGDYSFTVTLTDAAARQDTCDYRVIIHPAIELIVPDFGPQVVGESNDYGLIATGGLPPYHFAMVGAGPAGFVLTGSGGLHIEAPVAAAYEFQVLVVDSRSIGITALLHVDVYNPLLITTTILPNVVSGDQYNADITAEGGANAGYTWTLVDGALPPGIELVQGTPSATLSGLASAEGTYAFTLEIDDHLLAPHARQFEIVVLASLQITTEVLEIATIGIPYSQIVEALGGGGTTYAWSVADGELPDGLDLVGGTPNARISGFATTAGKSEFFLKVEDGIGHAARRRFTLEVVVPLEILTTLLPNAFRGETYGAEIAATGSTGAYVWSVIAGSLPSGLSLAPGTPTAHFLGAPDVVGVFSFTIQVETAQCVDAHPFQLVIYEPLALLDEELPTGFVDVSYGRKLEATGGAGGPYSWGLIGNLPDGLRMESMEYVVYTYPSTWTSVSFMTIAGLPELAATYHFQLQIADVANNVRVRDATLRIEPNASRLEIMISEYYPYVDFPWGQALTPYSHVVHSRGGSGVDLNWSISRGSLPPGLTLTSAGATATVSGILPLFYVNDEGFELTLTDSLGNVAKARCRIEIMLTPSQEWYPMLGWDEEEVAVEGQYFEKVLYGDARDCTELTWTTSDLPPGLSLQPCPQGWMIAGTPSGTATYYCFVGFTSGTGRTAAGYCPLEVLNAPQALGIVDTFLAVVTPAFPPFPASDPTIQVGSWQGAPAAVCFTLRAYGGSGTGYTWRLKSGLLPPGLGIHQKENQNLEIRGTLEMTLPIRYFIAVFEVEDSLGNLAEITTRIAISG
ncbi:MAG: hypothetical protein IT462_09615 [Planctomycetes bacterium]|nr:hypothetical protein [Planctomycetota bacterium]